MRNGGKRLAALLLALSLALSLAACGKGENAAATMRLVKTQGTVEVADTKGKSVKIMENLGLFSGYALATRKESYGWINLDDTKLAKMDAQSEVKVKKEDKLLELDIRSGNLFFNVTEPLAEDETMNIRTSTMLLGIRGTCGWVEVQDESLMCVYLLRGKVECAILGKDGGILASEMLSAGQAAKMVLEDGEATIILAAFDTEMAPDFVKEALNEPVSPGNGGGPAGKAEQEGAMQEGPASEKAQEGADNAKPAEAVRFVPWAKAGLEDHVMDWGDPALAETMAVETGITDRDIMLSDVWELRYFEPGNHGVEVSHGISDISALAELKNLNRLVLTNSNITDLSPIAGLTNLTDLGIGMCPISDISPIAGLTNLDYLEMAATSVSDISPLKGLTNLTRLNLHNDNSISDISALQGLTKLTFLSLPAAQISDISALSGMTELEQLEAGGNSISDLRPLADMKKLRRLYIADNKISDISPLKGLTNLVGLELGKNHISDISPLQGLTQLQSLGLRDNAISDVSPLKGLTGLTSLYLKGNSISDYSPVDFVQSVQK